MNKHNHNEICPVCGEGTLVAYNDGIYKFRYQRQDYTVDGILYAKCDSCGVSGHLTGQLSANKAKIKTFQKSIVSFISPSDILSLREKYNLSQETASKIFGGGSQAFSKWERGIIIPAVPTAKLMLLALESPDVMNRLANLVNVKLNADSQLKIKKIASKVRGNKSHPIISRGVYEVGLLASACKLKLRSKKVWSEYTNAEFKSTDIDLFNIENLWQNPEPSKMKLSLN